MDRDGPVYQPRRRYEQFYVDVEDVTPDGSFGAVLQCGGAKSPEALAQLRAYADAMAKAPTAQPLAATVNIVAGMGADRDGLAGWVADLRAAGAEEFRLYHAGLAAAADLEAVRALTL